VKSLFVCKIVHIECTVPFRSIRPSRAAHRGGLDEIGLRSQVTAHFGWCRNVVRKLGQKGAQFIKNRRQSTSPELYYITESLFFVRIIIVSPEASSAV